MCVHVMYGVTQLLFFIQLHVYLIVLYTLNFYFDHNLYNDCQLIATEIVCLHVYNGCMQVCMCYEPNRSLVLTFNMLSILALFSSVNCWIYTRHTAHMMIVNTRTV